MAWADTLSLIGQGGGPDGGPAIGRGTAQFDRAAELRVDPVRMAAFLAAGTVLPLWRGKPLVSADRALVWLASTDPVLSGGAPPVFLGMHNGMARFAQDISDWTPAPGAAGVEPGFFDGSEQSHPAAPEGAVFAELRGLMLALDAAGGELAATAKAVLGWHVSHRFCAACGAASEPGHAGWQRTCTACGTKHFPRTDPVVIMLVTLGTRLLMGRSPGWPEGRYSCLAGFVEPGETVEAAVRREVTEETGIRTGVVRYVASQPWPFPASLMMGFTAEALSEEITLDPAELEDARWVGRDEMMQAMSGTHPTMKAARRGAIAHFLIAGWLAGRLD